MIKRKITIHTPESLREKTIEDGDCLEWQGYFANKNPYVRHDGKVMSARRLFSSLMGKKFPAGGYVIPTCKNGKCVNPDHAKHLNQKQHLSFMGKMSKGNVIQSLHISQYQRKYRAKLDDKKVNDIRLSSLSSRKVGEKYNVSKTVVCRIRNGEAWKNTSSPFAGLMRG